MTTVGKGQTVEGDDLSKKEIVALKQIAKKAIMPQIPGYGIGFRFQGRKVTIPSGKTIPVRLYHFVDPKTGIEHMAYKDALTGTMTFAHTSAKLPEEPDESNLNRQLHRKFKSVPGANFTIMWPPYRCRVARVRAMQRVGVIKGYRATTRYGKRMIWSLGTDMQLDTKTDPEAFRLKSQTIISPEKYKPTAKLAKEMARVQRKAIREERRLPTSESLRRRYGQRK